MTVRTAVHTGALPPCKPSLRVKLKICATSFGPPGYGLNLGEMRARSLVYPGRFVLLRVTKSNRLLIECPLVHLPFVDVPRA